MFNVAIGSDHAGFELKEQLIEYLNSKKITLCDLGCYLPNSTDYADYGHAVANAILNKQAQFGILMCGSGNGINMTANKHNNIRAALCWNPEITALARQHNDANILVLPARFITLQQAKQCLDVFLTEKFEGGRHQLRTIKINLPN